MLHVAGYFSELLTPHFSGRAIPVQSTRMILYSAMDALEGDALCASPALLPLPDSNNARGKTLEQSCSLQFHAHVKGPAIIVKASLAQGFSLGDK